MKFGPILLLASSLLVAVLAIGWPETAARALLASGRLALRILLVFPLILLISILLAHFNVERFAKRVPGGWRGYAAAFILGILSMGPMYAWYPLLGEMRGRGVAESHIATFLYTRAIKPALLPMMLAFFGLAYTAALTIAIALAALTQGALFRLYETTTSTKD